MPNAISGNGSINQAALRAWTIAHPDDAELYASPDKIKKAINWLAVGAKDNRNAPGNYEDFRYRIKNLQSALAEIHNINGYDAPIDYGQPKR